MTVGGSGGCSGGCRRRPGWRWLWLDLWPACRWRWRGRSSCTGAHLWLTWLVSERETQLREFVAVHGILYPPHQEKCCYNNEKPIQLVHWEIKGEITISYCNPLTFQETAQLSGDLCPKEQLCRGCTCVCLFVCICTLNFIYSYNNSMQLF